MSEERTPAGSGAAAERSLVPTPPGKPRIGGMALANGVLVHGPDHWACAVRDGDGAVQVASGEKPVLMPGVRSPLLRGLARIAEGLAVVPAAAGALPAAQVPYRNRRMLAVLGLGWALSRSVRASRLPLLQQEILLADGFARAARGRPARLGRRRLPRSRARDDRKLGAR